MEESEWRWNSENGRWELVEVDTMHADELVAGAAVNTTNLGCITLGAVVAGLGWLVRWLRRRA